MSTSQKTMKLLDTQTVVLPDDVVLDQILPRLPVKSLLRFKSVCKYWYTYISNPKFTKTQLQFSSFCPKFLLRHGHCMYSLSFNDQNKRSMRELVRLNDQDDMFGLQPKIIDSHNGLVCMYVNDQGSEKDCFVLWNPATSEYRNVDSPKPKCVTLYAFGYLPALDDYKICVANFDKENTRLHFFVFSWRVGNWKEMSLSATIEKGLLQAGVLVHDTFFWVVYDSTHGSSNGCLIIGFNLAKEELIKVPLMDCFNSYKVIDIKGKGCLRLIGIKPDQAVDGWILRTQGESYHWEQKLSISSSRSSSYMNASTSGKCLIEHSGQLKLVDPTEVNLERYPEHDPKTGEVRDYIESLVSPFGKAEVQE